MKDILIYTWLTAAAASGGSSPFWMGANQYGLYPDKPGVVALAGIKKPFDESKTLQWRAGAALTGSLTDRARGHVDELYAGLRWKKLRLDAGIWHHPQDWMAISESLGSLSLTAGDFMWSGNARSMPGFNLVLEPAAIPFTGKHLWVWGNFGDYKTIDDRYAKGALIHNTSLFGRIDFSKRFSFTAGFNLWAQWGGENIMGNVNLKNYLKIITLRHGGEDAYIGAQESRLGNHLGNKIIRMQYRFDKWALTFQFDAPFEDKSGLYYGNFPDGSYSLHLRREDRRGWVTDCIAELQYTRYQSGAIHDREATAEEIASGACNNDPDLPYYHRIVLGGNDDYFNHEEYKYGWTHFGRVIGSPLFLFDSSLVNPDPGKRTDPVWNNRLVAVHAGCTGLLNHKWPYRLMLTWTRTWGTHLFPMTPSGQFYSAFTGEIPGLTKVRGLCFTYGLFADLGQLHNRLGAQIGVRYTI